VYRLRIVNGGNGRTIIVSFFNAASVHTLAATGPKAPSGGTAPLSFTIIGYDQGLLESAPETATEARIAPGQRVEILFSFVGRANTNVVLGVLGDVAYYWANAVQFNVGANTAATITVPTAAFYTVRTVLLISAPLTQWIAELGQYHCDGHEQELHALKVHLLHLSERTAHRAVQHQRHSVALNCHHCQRERNRAVDLGMGQHSEYSLTEGAARLQTNLDSEPHPMHIHGGDFVELRDGGATGPWMDTIVVDANVRCCCALATRASLFCGTQSQKRVLVRFGTEPGVFMQHCHMLEHEDNEVSPSQLASSSLTRTGR
jgi:hypothetical protein